MINFRRVKGFGSLQKALRCDIIKAHRIQHFFRLLLFRVVFVKDRRSVLARGVGAPSLRVEFADVFPDELFIAQHVRIKQNLHGFGMSGST